jgi:exopolyphosphatase/guanosine-5'-triphosphate,3'-diphosphate pyrophosphatase
MILSDRTIPFDDRTRRLVALVARGHRRKFPGDGDPLVQNLPTGDRKIAGMLAALLRVADGLDISHQGIVIIDSCTIGEDAVTCTISAREDPGPEIAAAQEKSDLFREMYGRPLSVSWGIGRER